MLIFFHDDSKLKFLYTYVTGTNFSLTSASVMNFSFFTEHIKLKSIGLVFQDCYFGSTQEWPVSEFILVKTSYYKFGPVIYPSNIDCSALLNEIFLS